MFESEKEIKVWLATILSTLLEVGGSPESSIYLALGMDIEKWNALKRIMIGSGLIQSNHHFVTLTDKGKELAKKIEAIRMDSVKEPA